MTSLQQHLLSANIILSDTQQSACMTFLQLLQKWNKTYNLTAITDNEKMVTHHLVDSLSISSYITGENIVDVGSGAGLPGIPLAIYFPKKKFTLLDSVGKKVRFMNHVVRELQLNNVTVLQARAEEYPIPESFDTMMARAVASAEKLIHIARHLLQENGVLLMMKSDVTQEQIVLPHRVIALTVPGVHAKRTLVMMQKDHSWQK